MSSILASNAISDKHQLIAQLLDSAMLFESDVVETLDRITTREDLALAAQFLSSLSSGSEATVNLSTIQAVLAQSAEVSPWPGLARLQQLFSPPIAPNPIAEITPALSQVAAGVQQSAVRILFSYKDKPKKREVSDFVQYFTARYHKLRAILQQRAELANLSSINRLRSRRDREAVSLIGIVMDKHVTKNGNLMLSVEDPTGSIKVLINKNRPDLFRLAQDIVFDEVLGINGVCGEGVVFTNSLVFPEVPVSRALKRSPDEAYAIFLSDIHVGSAKFLEAEFQKFLSWLCGETGSLAQRAIAAQVQYLLIMGDVVDGVGIYPGQERELAITDVLQQYTVLANLLKQVPAHIQIIMCPGNHDAMRISEPQPVFYRDFAPALYDIPNLTMVSNPGMVTIHASATFPGFDVLLYHGYSFDHYIANVDSIRLNGGYDRADLIMKFLLQKRHLAPTHTSTLYVPDSTDDPLVIDRVPDFFVTGHLHKTAVSSYRNVTLICGSCWQARTPFQEKMGHHPEPARVPIVNLKTREIKILRFDSLEAERSEGTQPPPTQSPVPVS